MLGKLYAAGGYLGPVDVGLAVTGLRGGVSQAMSQRIGFSARPFDRNDYRRTGRFSAVSLESEYRAAASELVQPLTRATTQERYDPFSEG